MIVRSPSDNVPKEVRRGVAQALKESVNILNLNNKKASFCSEFSEDAITWTVIRYLHLQQNLIVFARLAGRPELAVGMPNILIWGTPLPTIARSNRKASRDLSDRLADASRKLGENENRHTEPDLVLEWPELLLFCEVKYRSANEKKPDYDHFGRYLDNPDLFQASIRDVEKTGLYELVRNWRLGVELAEAKAFALLNLGPADVMESAEEFKRQARETTRRSFRGVTWQEFLGVLGRHEQWFAEFVLERRLGER